MKVYTFFSLVTSKPSLRCLFRRKPYAEILNLETLDLTTPFHSLALQLRS